MITIDSQMTVRARFGELDALRGALALWVFVGHYLEMLGVRAAGLISRTVLTTWIPVVVFMILSGFAITRSLIAEPVRYREFIMARAARLYPAYLAGLALGTISISAALRVVGELPNPSIRILNSQIFESTDAYYFQHLVSHLTFLHGMVEHVLPSSATGINPPMWSLSIEAQFYLAAPLIVAVFRNPVRWPIGLIALLISPLLWWLPHFIAAFALGIVTALYIDRLHREATALLHAALAVTAAATLTRDIYVMLPAAIWCLAIVIACWEGPPILTAVRCALNGRIAQFGGRISYSVYIYHYPVLLLTLDLARRAGFQHGTVALAAAFALAFPVTIAVATLSFYSLESPIHQLVKHHLEKSARASGRSNQPDRSE